MSTFIPLLTEICIHLYDILTIDNQRNRHNYNKVQHEFNNNTLALTDWSLTTTTTEYTHSIHNINTTIQPITNNIT